MKKVKLYSVGCGLLNISTIFNILVLLIILIIPGLILGYLLARKWGFLIGLIVGGILGYLICLGGSFAFVIYENLDMGIVLIIAVAIFGLVNFLGSFLTSRKFRIKKDKNQAIPPGPNI